MNIRYNVGRNGWKCPFSCRFSVDVVRDGLHFIFVCDNFNIITSNGAMPNGSIDLRLDQISMNHMDLCPHFFWLKNMNIGRNIYFNLDKKKSNFWCMIDICSVSSLMFSSIAVMSVLMSLMSSSISLLLIVYVKMVEMKTNMRKNLPFFSELFCLPHQQNPNYKYSLDTDFFQQPYASFSWFVLRNKNNENLDPILDSEEEYL